MSEELSFCFVNFVITLNTVNYINVLFEGEVVSFSKPSLFCCFDFLFTRQDLIYSLILSPLLKRARFDWLFSLSATTLLYRSMRLRWAASRFNFVL